MKRPLAVLSALLLFCCNSLLADDPPESRFAVMSPDEVRSYEQDTLRRVADLALIPPTLNTSPLPQYDSDKLDYGMTIGIERTPKGRLWACWVAGGDSPKAFFVLAISDDDGETWSKPRLVVDSQSKNLPRDRSILVGNLWTDPLGRLWLFFDQSMEMFDGRAGVWASVCDDPDAETPVWSAPRRIWHGVMLNKPTVLSTGEWMLPLSLDQRTGDGPFKGLFPELDPFRGANVFVSTDKGATWQRRAAVKFPNPDWHEHMIVERRDRSLWMLARTAKGIMQSTSTDGGRTWAEPTEPPGIRQPNARFHIRRLASGRLLLMKHGDKVDAHQGRVQLSAWLSDDDGKAWQGGLVLDERTGVSYPDGFQAPDGTIFISYDRNRATDGEILLARFTEADVLAKKLTGPKSKLKMLISRPLAPRPPQPAGRAAEIPKLLPTGWNPKATADEVLARLVRVSAPQVKGAHDAEFVCVGDRAYVVAEVDDKKGGEGADWPFIHATMSIVNLKTLRRVVDIARSEQVYANETLPAGACFVPRIIHKDPGTLRPSCMTTSPRSRPSATTTSRSRSSSASRPSTACRRHLDGHVPQRKGKLPLPDQQERQDVDRRLAEAVRAQWTERQADVRSVQRHLVSRKEQKGEQKVSGAKGVGAKGVRTLFLDSSLGHTSSMGRPKRPDEAGCIYHAINRGNARTAIFRKPADFDAFENILAEGLQRYPCQILAYQLMPNHWHFVLRPTVDGGMSNFLRWVSLTHTMRFHAHYRSVGAGHIYQGRFKSFPIQHDEHFLAVCRYVERNALRAGLVPRAEKWRWGSLSRWLAKSEPEPKVLTPWPIPRSPDWQSRVNAALSEAELTAIRRCVHRGSPFGDEKWTETTSRRLGLDSTLRPRGRPKKES